MCQKEPPFNTEEIVLIAAAREGIVDDQHNELMKSISWQREVPAAEANELLDTLQHQIAFIVPEATTIGLDGTIYELLIERSFSKVQFTWWCEPPLGWKALGEVASRVLSAPNLSAETRSRTRVSREPDGHRQRRSPGWSGSAQRHSSSLWFQMLGVEAHSSLPYDQYDRGNLPRQGQPPISDRIKGVPFWRS